MEQLGYILLGCVLMLVAMRLRRVNWSKIRSFPTLVVAKLRRVNWSKIRLPKFRRPRFALVPKMKNSLLVSVAVHVVLVVIGSILFVTKDSQYDYDALTIEWVTMPRTLWRAKKPKLIPVQPRIVHSRNLATPRVTAKPDDMMEAARRSFALVEKSANLPVDAPEAKMGDAKASMRLNPKKHHEVPKTNIEHVNVPERDKGKGRLGTKMVEDTSTVDSPSLEESDFSHLETLPDGKLGAIFMGEGRDISAHIRLIRLKHSLSDWWQDPTAMPSLFKWLRENTRIRADMKFKGGSLRLTDPDIQDAPLIFMTGHDKDITTAVTSPKTDRYRKGFPQQNAKRCGRISSTGAECFSLMTVGSTDFLLNRSRLSSTESSLNTRSRISRTTTRFTNSITSSPYLPGEATYFGVLRARPKAWEVSIEQSPRSSRTRKGSRLAAD